MNCNRLRAELTERGLGSVAERHRDHLDGCELCRLWLEDRRLIQALATPVPEPSPGFEDRAIRRAVSASPRRLRQPAAAAAAVLALAASLAAWLAGHGPDRPGAADPVLAVAPRVINVVIDTKDHRQDALLTIELAEDLELEGYAGQHLIEWRADLAKGRHLLALPVRMKTGVGGEIRIALTHGGSTPTRVRIPVGAG